MEKIKEKTEMGVALESKTILNNYPMYTEPLIHASYLARWELFKKVLHIEGCILECGTAWGGGLLAWQHFSWILEPHNFVRKMYGFDAFDNEINFPTLTGNDAAIGDSFSSNQEHLQDVINRFSAEHQKAVLKTYLVPGDACETIPKWCADKPHALVALLYLDFDVYEPTKVALQYLVPRMPKGAIIAFDECNYGKWPGETVALMDTLGIGNVKLQRFPWCQIMAYMEI